MDNASFGSDNACKKKFLVDTKGLCLLCYQPASNHLNGDENLEEGEANRAATQFQILSRYLNINLRDILDSSQKYPTGGLLKNFELQVSFCGRCSKVISNFFTLYQDLEITLMLLSSFIQQIRDLVARSDRNHSLVEEYWRRTKMGQGQSSDGVKQAIIVENIREVMIEKCSSYLKQSTPRIVIDRVDGYGGTRTNGSQSDQGPCANGLEDTSENLLEESTDQIVSRRGRPAKKDIIISKPLRRFKHPTYGWRIIYQHFCTICKKTVADKTCHRRTHSSKNRLSCTHCSATGFASSQSLSYHVCLKHSDLHFLPCKDHTLSKEQFLVAVQLLFQNINISSRAGYGEERRYKYKCPHCSIGTFATKHIVRNHMIQSHYKILCQKLGELQKDPARLDANKHLVDESFGSRGTAVESQKITAVSSTPYNLGEPNLSNDNGIDDLVANEGFPTEVHRRKRGPKPPVSTDFFVTVKVGQVKSVSGYLQPKYSHFCKLCNKTVSNQTLHRRVHTGEQTVKCTLCEKKFLNSSAFQYHNIMKHCDHHFLEYKKPKVTDEQFKVAVELLFRHIKMTSRTAKNGDQEQFYKCPNCSGAGSSRFQTKYSVRSHMLQNHRDQLGEELNDLQTNTGMIAKNMRLLEVTNPLKQYRSRLKSVRAMQDKFAEQNSVREESQNGNGWSEVGAAIVKLENAIIDELPQSSMTMSLTQSNSEAWNNLEDGVAGESDEELTVTQNHNTNCVSIDDFDSGEMEMEVESTTAPTLFILP